MTINITYPDGSTCAELTTESSASHYGIPVVRIEDDGRPRDLGPRDIVHPEAQQTFGDHDGTAAALIANWADSRELAAKERRAAELFCAQWPDGPQPRNTVN